VTLTGDMAIDIGHLPHDLRRLPPVDVPIELPEDGLNMEAVEISLLRQALGRAQGNKTRAAELLGLTRHTLLYRLEKYGLDT
jgi:transcriptional regulator with PAS, ATPase and Fis domain